MNNNACLVEGAIHFIDAFSTLCMIDFVLLSLISHLNIIILQIAQLNALINMLLGELTPGVRQKIMTICTIDVHARDVVAKLIAQKVI